MKIMVNGTIPVRSHEKVSVCKGCGAYITWGTTEAGKYMPFDSDLNHTSHWSTCPEAKKFRKQKSE